MKLLFEELIIKKNENGTYSMEVKAYTNADIGIPVNVEVPKMTNLTFNLIQDTEVEAVTFNRYDKRTISTHTKYTIEIAASLLPNEKDQVVSFIKM